MFNLFKKTKPANHKVSSANMSSDEYIKAVEGGIIPHWEDRILMQKIGVKNLFDENVTVTNKLSYEDACDCLRRAMRMVDMANYVSQEFNDRSRALNSRNPNAFKNHLSDVCNGTAVGTFEIKDDFYSANTIRDLFIEAQKNVVVNPIDNPQDLNSAIEKLNSAVGSLNHIKKLTFLGILMSAKASFANMKGFI